MDAEFVKRDVVLAYGGGGLSSEYLGAGGILVSVKLVPEVAAADWLLIRLRALLNSDVSVATALGGCDGVDGVVGKGGSGEG